VVRKGGNGPDEPEKVETPDAPEAEERGLAGVDAPPLPPADREQLEAVRKENEELRDQLLRRRADFENYKKRVERDREQAGLDAVAAVLKALIPTIDNLDRALSATGSEEVLREGVELTRRDLLAFLERHGVKTEDPAGGKFDPERHQALSHEVVEGFPEGTVVEVFRKGYSYRDRLLRPALVKVAKAPDGPSEKGPEALH
jgi:molecular chaperone GrpE